MGERPWLTRRSSVPYNERNPGTQTGTRGLQDRMIPQEDNRSSVLVSPKELRDLIEKTKITQRETAHRCRVTERAVRQWLAGDRRMPLLASEILALSLALPGDFQRMSPKDPVLERWVRPQFLEFLSTADEG